MQPWMKSLLNFLYPNRCPACGIYLDAHALLCEYCSEKLLLSQNDYCTSCGKTRCICGKKELAYNRAVICSCYDGGAVPAILELKRSRNTNFAYYAAQILAARLESSASYSQVDCVMPVPMHPENQRMRGYNQAALIAQEIARLMELPYRDDVLFKQKGHAAQHTLGPEARAKNVESFGIHECSLDGLHILLCDDVLTTGSTMSRCAALLKERGAASVTAAAATTSVPKPRQEDTI